jgi:hypothetical protein
MPQYKHTQVGYLTLFSLGLPIAVLAVVMAVTHETFAISGAVIGLLLVSGLLFGALTVEVKNDIVRIEFGVGIIRKSWRISEFQSCEVVKNPWWWGWGIRSTPHGWLYNVSGTSAVQITTKSGQEFRIGSDEPEALRQAIVAAMGR